MQTLRAAERRWLVYEQDSALLGVETAPGPVLPATVIHPLRPLGGSELRLFPVALACGTFGWSADARSSAAILSRFVEAGGNFIDASCMHPDGRSELAVGAWFAQGGVRDRVLLGTTVGAHHDLSESPAQVIPHAVDTALSRLRTDHLDLLSVKLAPDTGEQVLVAIDELVRAGKVRHAAAASPTADQLVEARVLAGQLGIMPLAAVQARYNLAERAGFEAGLSRMIALQSSGFLARHPLAGGLLSARQRSRQELDRLSRTNSPAPISARRRSNILTALTKVADELSASVSRVALAWLLSRGNVSAVMVSASDPEQVVDALAAAETTLSRHHVAELDRVSR